MGRQEEPLQSGFTLGQLLPIRIHDYITTIHLHRRYNNLQGHLDVLEQWGFDITSYMTENQLSSFEGALSNARAVISNGYKSPESAKVFLREAERILHRSSDKAGLKASNIEAQQIVDTSEIMKEIETVRKGLR